MSEWNGQEISEMDTSHIESTIKLLEKRAKTAYATEQLAVENTLDSFRAQAFDEKDWTDFLHESYHALATELAKRGPDLSMNF